MNTEKDVLVLAKSKKYNNYCIAGYDINKQELVRIISNNPAIHYSVPRSDLIMSNTNSEVEILDVIRLEAKKVNPPKDNPHQIENWEYNPKVKWTKLKSLSVNEIPQTLYSQDELLFFNTKRLLTIQDMSLIDGGFKSLQLILPSYLEFRIKVYEEETKIYANVRWNGQVYREIPLTDTYYSNIILEEYKKSKKQFFFINQNNTLMISLSGLYEKFMCYYKLIASIIVQPNGKICSKDTMFFSRIRSN